MFSFILQQRHEDDSNPIASYLRVASIAVGAYEYVANIEFNSRAVGDDTYRTKSAVMSILCQLNIACIVHNHLCGR